MIIHPPARPDILTTYHAACPRTRVGAAWLRIAMLAAALLGLASSLAQAQVPLSGVQKIAAGNGHTCALTIGGAVQCWGFNGNGQLGDGGTTQRLVPTAVPSLTSGVTAIAAGFFHTCALTIGGAVQCWGNNGNGQLGDGGTTQRLVPTAVPSLTSGVTAIAAGGFHTCALTSGGAVQCWGSNSEGQLGDNTTTQRLVPTTIPSLTSGVTAIAAGGSHTCALTSGGAVQCWGRNFNGQIGDGTFTGRRPFPASVIGFFAPGAPTIGTAAAGNTQATVAFAIPASNGGSAITSFTATSNPGSITGSCTAPCTSIPVMGLTNGTAYTFTVTATNGIGTSTASGVSNSVTPVGSQTVSFTPATPVVFGVGPITLTATASSGLTAFTFSTSSANTICTVAGNQLTIVGGGTCALTANQAGNASFASASANANVVINAASQTVTFAPATPVAFGVGPITLTATASSGLTAFTFSTSSANTICTVAGNQLTIVGTGTCALTANQAGNTNFVSASANANVVITAGAQTVTFAPASPVALGVAPITLTATASSGLTTFTFATSSANNICTVAANQLTIVGGGTCALTATQAGNANFASASANANVVINAGANAALFSNTSIAGYGAPVILRAAVTGIAVTGTVTFSVFANTGQVTLPGCSAVPLVGGTASCIAPGTYQTQNPRLYLAAYSGDANNSPLSTSLSQAVGTNVAVVSVAAFPLPPIAAGRTTTLTALVKMSSPVGRVTFFDNGVPVTGCAQLSLAILPDAVDSAVANCTVTAPSSTTGSKQYVVSYFYPAGHISGRVFEQVSFDMRVVAQAPQDYTDMWWAGPSENGWGMSVTQHGPIQFNVIFAYDAQGKSVWYVMPGGSFNAAGTVFTGPLYLPTSSPFSAYDKTRFVIGAPVGSATITYSGASTATLAYTINGISASKSIQRQIFSLETTGANLRINDLWWATFAEDGWGMNIAQQGRVLFPVWYTYDATGKPTFFTAQVGNWNGTVWSGVLYSHESSPWLGVTYNPAAFKAIIVGTISLDFSDASNATMTTTVNGITQVRRIERQPY